MLGGMLDGKLGENLDEKSGEKLVVRKFLPYFMVSRWNMR
jgi:hypothetical protein